MFFATLTFLISIIDENSKSFRSRQTSNTDAMFQMLEFYSSLLVVLDRYGNIGLVRYGDLEAAFEFEKHMAGVCFSYNTFLPLFFSLF